VRGLKVGAAVQGTAAPTVFWHFSIAASIATFLWQNHTQQSDANTSRYGRIAAGKRLSDAMERIAERDNVGPDADELIS
jgi:hypothetical protein